MISLQDAADISTIAQFVFWLAITFGGGFLVLGYIRNMRPVWKRFSDNVNRTLAVVSTEKQPMEHKADLLKRVGYFKKVKPVTADKRNLNLLEDCALIVVGYSPDSEVYKATFKYAEAEKLPIIVFAGKNELDRNGEDFKNLMGYSFGSLCQTELRLVSDVFAVMSTFPEKKS